MLAQLLLWKNALEEFVAALQAAKAEWADPTTQAFLAAL